MTVMLSHILFKLIGGIAGLNDARCVKAPVFAGLFALSLLIAGSADEIAEFSSMIVLPGNILLGIAVPATVLAVAACRCKLRARRAKKAPRL
jgi:hypothetical protein